MSFSSTDSKFSLSLCLELLNILFGQIGRLFPISSATVEATSEKLSLEFRTVFNVLVSSLTYISEEGDNLFHDRRRKVLSEESAIPFFQHDLAICQI